MQHEPADFFDPDTVGLFAAIGIKKGKTFAPDARMKAILTDAVAVGNATARAMTFAPRDPRQRFFTDRQWNTAFLRRLRRSRMAASACWTHVRCSTTTPPASRRRWPRQARRRVGLRIHGQRCARRVARRRQDLQGHAAGADPGRPLLVVHRLRQPDTLDARDRPDQRRSRQHVSQPEEERRRLGHDLLRPEGARGSGGQLGPDHAREGLERVPPALRAAGGVVQQELEAGRFRAGECDSAEHNEESRS